MEIREKAYERNGVRVDGKDRRGLGRVHANGKLCRVETYIESAAGSMEAEVETRRRSLFIPRRCTHSTTSAS